MSGKDLRAVNPHTPVPGPGLLGMVSLAQSLEAQIVAHAEAHYGEVDPKVDEFLQSVEREIAEKADAYKYIMDRLEIEAEQWARNADQFLRVARSLDQTRERLKERIKAVMQMRGTDEVSGTNWKFKLENAAPRLEVVVEDLPPEYTVAKTVIEPDKEKIKNAMKLGLDLPGVISHEVKRLVPRIKKAD